jgi:hypothetical protein
MSEEWASAGNVYLPVAYAGPQDPADVLGIDWHRGVYHYIESRLAHTLVDGDPRFSLLPYPPPRYGHAAAQPPKP